MIVQLEKENRLHKAKITKLERDVEMECRSDSLWDEAETIHEWWRLATGHFKTSFDAEDFALIRPHLKRLGPVGCLQAICGAAYEPATRQLKNGREKRFDDFELIFREKAKLESFAERVPGEEGTEQWKSWLLRRIEESLD